MNSWAFSAAQNRAFALRIEPLASLNRHAADHQSLTRRHALRIRLFCPIHRKTKYRFSEREGWHLGEPAPRPQETGWRSLSQQGPCSRLGVVVRGGTGLHREAAPLVLAEPFPALLAGCRDAAGLRSGRHPPRAGSPLPESKPGGPPPPLGYRERCSV